MMKPHLAILLLITSLFFSGCNFKEREDKLKKKSDELKQKEEQLLSWENNLKLKEDSINLILTLRDSTISKDSIEPLPAALAGQWTTKRIVTQTNCSGWALGDAITDTWELSSQDSTVVIKTITSGQVTRVYMGNYFKNNRIKTSAQSDPQSEQTATGRSIELTDIKDKKIKGTAIVTQPDGCHITYSIEMDKKP